MSEGERHSQPVTPAPKRVLSPDEVAAIEARNGLAQFDRVVKLIDQSCSATGPRFRLRHSTILDLNRIAVDQIVDPPGAYRSVEIEITGSKHAPPTPRDLPLELDLMCEYVQSYWSEKSPLHLAAYVMWRLNWIHPFVDGNGRTSRAASYLVLCAKLGYRLPGTKTIPERIAENKTPYYHALDAADAAWKASGEVDVSQMERLLDDHLAAQLVEVHDRAAGRS
jgi:fido (protein-threonine AMPylation protein)